VRAAGLATEPVRPAAADLRAVATHPVPAAFRIGRLVSGAVAEAVLEAVPVWETEAVVSAAATAQAGLAAVVLTVDRAVIGAVAEPA